MAPTQYQGQVPTHCTRSVVLPVYLTVPILSPVGVVVGLAIGLDTYTYVSFPPVPSQDPQE